MHLSDERALEASPAALCEVVVEVEDREGRFLSCQFAAWLPHAGLLSLPECAPPDIPAQTIPLYSAPARLAPGLIAAVRAELYDTSAGRPAAWALLEAFSGTTLQARGVSDAHGVALLLFAYPAPPRQLMGSPGGGGVPLLLQTWSLRLSAYYAPGSAAPAVLPLCALLHQPPATLLASESPATPFDTVELVFGQELIVATVGRSDRQLAVKPEGSPPS